MSFQIHLHQLSKNNSVFARFTNIQSFEEVKIELIECYITTQIVIYFYPVNKIIRTIHMLVSNYDTERQKDLKNLKHAQAKKNYYNFHS